MLDNQEDFDLIPEGRKKSSLKILTSAPVYAAQLSSILVYSNHPSIHPSSVIKGKEEKQIIFSYICFIIIFATQQINQLTLVELKGLVGLGFMAYQPL